MFSIEQVNKNSRHVAYIYNKEKKKIKDYIFFTDLTVQEDRDNKYKEQSDEFHDIMKKYSENILDTELDYKWRLKPEYELKLLPSNYTKTVERECISVIGKSGSGKSYFINQYIADYMKLNPKNMVYYVSLNDITKDTSFKKHKNLRQIKISDISNVLDVSLYPDSLFVFDDILDVKPSIDLSEYFDEKTLKSMSLKEKVTQTRLLERKMIQIISFIKESAINIHNLGRKYHISCISVFHKGKSGQVSSFVASESTSVVLYPHGIPKQTLNDYLVDRLSLSKDTAKYITSLKTYLYSFLYINTTGRTFFITPDTISIFK